MSKKLQTVTTASSIDQFLRVTVSTFAAPLPDKIDPVLCVTHIQT